MMWEDVGVMRTAGGMERGLTQLQDIRAELMETGVADGVRAFNLTWHDWLNMVSLCDISEVIASAGLARENSRGAHWREDFPEEGDMPNSYFTVACQKDGALEISRDPVDFSIVKYGETILPEGEPETLVAAE
jgi:fumarate reductase flavoprotein subunit